MFSILRRTLRLHQWAKNLLVFVPLFLSGQAGILANWPPLVAGFVALGLIASTTYIANDMADIEHDRLHRSKRYRPLAAGQITLLGAGLLAVCCFVVGIGIGAALSWSALVVLLIYAVVSLAYSFSIKRVPLLDTLVLSGLFTIRLAFGIVVVDVRASPWLLVFSSFVFLSLSLAKRYIELERLDEITGSVARGRGYGRTDMPLILGMGLASMFSSVLIFTLFLIDDAIPRGVYTQTSFLWVAPPTLFLFLGRIWLLAHRGQLHDDPVAFALRDRVTLLLGACISIAFCGAMVLPQ